MAEIAQGRVDVCSHPTLFEALQQSKLARSLEGRSVGVAAAGIPVIDERLPPLGERVFALADSDDFKEPSCEVRTTFSGQTNQDKTKRTAKMIAMKPRIQIAAR
jgi:hypothetical protein